MDYDITAILQANFDRKSVYAILKQADGLGILFFDYIEGVRYGNSPIISLDQVIEKVMEGQEGLHNTYIRLYDTQCFLGFGKLDKINCLHFSMFGFSFEWEKCFFEEVQSFDLARYTYVFLELAKDFRILEFKGGNEYSFTS